VLVNQNCYLGVQIIRHTEVLFCTLCCFEKCHVIQATLEPCGKNKSLLRTLVQTLKSNLIEIFQMD
jgi:hypothetical protein